MKYIISLINKDTPMFQIEPKTIDLQECFVSYHTSNPISSYTTYGSNYTSSPSHETGTMVGSSGPENIQTYGNSNASSMERQNPESKSQKQKKPQNRNLQKYQEVLGGSMNYFQKQDPKIFSLKKNSEAIIFIKQSYEQLYRNGEIKVPKIKSVEIHFFNSLNLSQKIIFSISENITQIDNPRTDVSIKFSPSLGGKNAHKTFQFKIIPGTIKPTQSAKQLLQKKLWIKLSASTNSASINFNDFSSVNDQNTKLQTTLGLPQRNTWYSAEDIYQYHKSQHKTSKGSPYRNINCFQMFINYSFEQNNIQLYKYKGNQFENQRKQDILKQLRKLFKVQIFDIKKTQSSVLTKNPSLLRLDANLHYLTSQTRILYEYLENMTLTQLPKLDDSAQKLALQTKYYDWKSLNNAIHYSIATRPGYVIYEQGKTDAKTNKIQWKTVKRPVGILNVLMQMKSFNIDKLNKESIFEWKQIDWKDLSNQENKDKPFSMEKVYKERMSYVRMQLTKHEGLSPGSIAVLEIWPPFCCSPIHNHGEAFGLVKVLSNEIMVQNFNDLNFTKQDNLPYQQNIYQQGDYTWLSEYSYGIHRLINITKKTTLTLQSYMGGQFSTQYFEFIDPEKKQYAEYHPQNDWLNFLKWPTLIKVQQKSYNPFVKKFIQYVKYVKQFYGLKDNSPNFFFDFVTTLKKEYETCHYFMDSKKGNYKIRNVLFEPFKATKDEAKQQKY